MPLGIRFVVHRTGTLDPLDVWLAIFAGHVVRCLLSVLRFNRGAWRNIEVDLAPPRR